MDDIQEPRGTRVADEQGEESAAKPGEPDPHRDRMIRQLSWTLVWAIPLLALFVGIVLTSIGTTEVWHDYGDGAVDVTLVALWPVGLVLLGAGLLGVMAASIANAVRVSGR